MDAQKIVSDSLIENVFKTVRMGGRFFTIPAPWTVTTARALGKLEGLNVPDGLTDLDAISSIPSHASKFAAFIAVLCVGNVRRWGVIERIRYARAFKMAMRTTESEKKYILSTCFSLINGSDFFDYASWGMKLVGQMAKAKQE